MSLEGAIQGMTQALQSMTGVLAENRDLRDVVRLIIGRETGVPWYEVPEAAVDNYLAAARVLKKLNPPPEGRT
jgi:hypothetical protein